MSLLGMMVLTHSATRGSSDLGTPALDYKLSKQGIILSNNMDHKPPLTATSLSFPYRIVVVRPSPDFYADVECCKVEKAGIREDGCILAYRNITAVVGASRSHCTWCIFAGPFNYINGLLMETKTWILQLSYSRSITPCWMPPR